MRYLRIFSAFLILLGFSVSAGFAQTARSSDDFSDVYKKYQEAVEEGNYSQASNYAQGAYDLGKEKFGEGSSEAATLAYNLGFTLNQLHNFEEALPFLYEGLKGLMAIHGEENIILLDSHMELGKANARLFKQKSSKFNFNRAIKLAEKEYGGEYNFLMDLYLEIGNYLYITNQTDPEDYFEQAYLIGTTHFAEGNYRTGIAAFSLGKIFDSKKRKKKAEQYYLETLQIYEKAPPPSLEFVMVAHTFLVQFYSQKGDDIKATEHCVKVGFLRGDENIDSARPLYKMRPTYPPSALADNQEGTVLIKYSVGPDGKVINPIIEDSSSKAFSKMALETIQQWRYAPRVVDGKPVQTDDLLYRIHFSISR